jgi:hypothetical protein
MRRIRTLIFVIIAAVGGAILGRMAADARRQREAGESFQPGAVQLKPQDLIPGIVAAMRVRDRPWSWLHIPSWLAAFAVNFAVGAIGSDLQRLREMAERGEMPPFMNQYRRHSTNGDAGPEWHATEVTADDEEANEPSSSAY